MKRYLWLALLYLAACKLEQSKVKDGIYSSYLWYKTPAEIEATVKSWGVTIYDQERKEHFTDLGQSYGGASRSGQVLLGAGPDVLYVLAIAKVSEWLVGMGMGSMVPGGVGRRASRSAGEPRFPIMERMFAGGDKDTDSCFDNDKQSWCDFDDELTVNTYKIVDAEKLKTSPADRKKIMHNMQDIGDFVGVVIDNLTKIDGYDHVPHYLLEEVFIPNLNEYGDLYAWQKVILAILLRGPFFMHLDQYERSD